MSEKPNDSASSTFNFQATLDVAKQTASDAVKQAVTAFDYGVRSVTKEIVGAANSAIELKEEVSNQAKAGISEAEKYVAVGVQQYKEVEGTALSYAKCGVKWGLENPTVSYTVLGAGAVLALPFTRGFLYRATLGRFQNAETTFNNSVSKLETIKGNAEKFALEAKKLEERRLAAEAEFKSGIAKLRATRDELQRLSTAVSKNQRAASGVLEDLRIVKKIENSAQARAEAAQKVSELKSTAAAIEKNIHRINVKDI